MAPVISKPYKTWPDELKETIAEYLPNPDDSVLKAALDKFEMDEDYEMTEMLPCYTCLRILDEDKFWTKTNSGRRQILHVSISL
jgi:hypothetical protein